jgi:hypothetical protein
LPSYGRQLAHEAELRALREQAENAERSSVEEYDDL